MLKASGHEWKKEEKITYLSEKKKKKLNEQKLASFFYMFTFVGRNLGNDYLPKINENFMQTKPFLRHN